MSRMHPECPDTQILLIAVAADVVFRREPDGEEDGEEEDEEDQGNGKEDGDDDDEDDDGYSE